MVSRMNNESFPCLSGVCSHNESAREQYPGIMDDIVPPHMPKCDLF